MPGAPTATFARWTSRPLLHSCSSRDPRCTTTCQGLRPSVMPSPRTQPRPPFGRPGTTIRYHLSPSLPARDETASTGVGWKSSGRYSGQVASTSASGDGAVWTARLGTDTNPTPRTGAGGLGGAAEADGRNSASPAAATPSERTRRVRRGTAASLRCHRFERERPDRVGGERPGGAVSWSQLAQGESLVEEALAGNERVPRAAAPARHADPLEAEGEPVAHLLSAVPRLGGRDRLPPAARSCKSDRRSRRL